MSSHSPYRWQTDSYTHDSRYCHECPVASSSSSYSPTGAAYSYERPTPSPQYDTLSNSSSSPSLDYHYKPHIRLATNFSPSSDRGCRSATSSASPVSPAISHPLTPAMYEPVWVSVRQVPPYGLAESTPGIQHHDDISPFPHMEKESTAFRSGLAGASPVEPIAAGVDWGYDIKSRGGQIGCSSDERYYADRTIPDLPRFSPPSHHRRPANISSTSSLSNALSLPTPSKRQVPASSRKDPPIVVHQPRPIRPIPIMSLTSLSSAACSPSFSSSFPDSAPSAAESVSTSSPGNDVEMAVTGDWHQHPEQSPFRAGGDVLLFQPISPQVLAQYADRCDVEMT